MSFKHPVHPKIVFRGPRVDVGDGVATYQPQWCLASRNYSSCIVRRKSHRDKLQVYSISRVATQDIERRMVPTSRNPEPRYVGDSRDRTSLGICWRELRLHSVFCGLVKDWIWCVAGFFRALPLIDATGPPGLSSSALRDKGQHHTCSRVAIYVESCLSAWHQGFADSPGYEDDL